MAVTVHHPSGSGSIRAYLIDDRGYVACEINIPRSAAEERCVVSAFLPSYLKCPRWDGERWIEMHGWYRQALWLLREWWRNRSV